MSESKDNVDAPMRAAYELWRDAFYQKNISTTPAYDVVGLLAALCMREAPDGSKHSEKYFDESELGSNKNVPQEGATVYKLKPECRKKNCLDEIFSNMAAFGASDVKIGIITDFGEECDDEVTCLLASRLPGAGLGDVRFLFTTAESRFEAQKKTFVKWANSSEQETRASKMRSKEFATRISSIYQANDFIKWLNEGPSETKRIILQIGPIHEPESKPTDSGWQTKKIWRPKLTCNYNYIAVGTFNGVAALNVKGDSRLSALHLMSKAQQKVVVDTMAGLGAFKFSASALRILFPEVDMEDRSSIIEHVCKIGWRNSVGRASAYGGKWVAHLVSEAAPPFKGGANFMTMKKIQEEMNEDVPKSCGSIQLANKYLDQLKTLGGLQVEPSSKTNNPNGATSVSIVNGYSYILDCLAHFFKVPVQFFESGRPEHWRSQWETPSIKDSPEEANKFHIEAAYKFVPIRCRSPPAAAAPVAPDEEDESAFLSGIPAGHLIHGIGEYTRGISLYVRQEHLPGSPSLSGSYKLADGHSQAGQLLSEHMPVDSPILEVMIQALTSSKQYNFDDLRTKILDQIGVETNADILNYHLFHPSQWKVGGI